MRRGRSGVAPPVLAVPGDSLQIRAETIQPVGPYQVDNHFAGPIDAITLTIGE